MALLSPFQISKFKPGASKSQLVKQDNRYHCFIIRLKYVISPALVAEVARAKFCFQAASKSAHFNN